MKKRKKSNEQDPQWWEALHKIQDWDAQGVPHREIARRLGREGYSIGRGQRSVLWSDTAVTRALDTYPRETEVSPLHPMMAEDLLDTSHVTEEQFVNDEGEKKARLINYAVAPGDFDSEADYQAFKADVMKRASAEPRREPWKTEDDGRGLRAYPKLQPRDWTRETEPGLNDAWRNTWAVGEQGWDQGIVPYVAQHVRASGGWSALDRIDRLGGDPIDRAKLRMVFLGLMRRLCMREETVLALKAEVERLKAR